MKHEKDKDCPLCLAQKVISYTESKLVTHTTPNPNKRVIGNYQISHEGGGYQYKTHAEKCPRLEDVFNKEGLLRYHAGDLNIIQRGFAKLTFEDYQEVFQKNGFAIYVDVKRIDEYPLGEKKWGFEMYLMGSLPHYDMRKKYLITKGKTPDETFDLFKHRLICGEIVFVAIKERDYPVEEWQFHMDMELQNISFNKI